MCLVIEFLSDLINALAVSLSRRCHPHIFQKKNKKCSLCMLACPHDCAHMEDDNSYARIHTHTHKPCKNPVFFLQLQLQPQPSVLCCGGLYSKPRLTCHPTSRWLTPGPQMEADLAGFAFFFFFLPFFFFFWCLHNLQTPYHEDVSSELRPYKAGERGSSEAVRGGGEEKKATGFIFRSLPFCQ